MLTKSSIEWTEATWNPVTGCNKISPGCDHCYAERMAKRLQGMGVHKYRNGFKVTMHEDVLDAPLRWKKPQRIFVNSMSDLFHEDIPLEFIQKVFATMVKAEQHIFQILTKRPKRLVRVHEQLPWPKNIWMGVTVENQDYVYRIKDLRKTNAQTRFLSLEPLIGPLPNLDLSGIHWAIVGGESGPGARPMKRAWANDIRKQCREQNVAFFFKQWGGVFKSQTGRILNQTTYDEYPSDKRFAKAG